MGPFVLTKQEKRIILFVVFAFLLGLAVKTYRETHPQSPPTVPAVEKTRPKPKLGDD
ncbi:MAG TPA: hypothetical protein VJ719_02730 [Chthoniobacterales bacterium]|nr:hypothetical protein [Chthoniobacterales bacterium]